MARGKNKNFSADNLRVRLALIDGGGLGAAFVAVNEVEIADAHEVQDGCVEVVDV